MPQVTQLIMLKPIFKSRMTFLNNHLLVQGAHSVMLKSVDFIIGNMPSEL